MLLTFLILFGILAFTAGAKFYRLNIPSIVKWMVVLPIVLWSLANLDAYYIREIARP